MLSSDPAAAQLPAGTCRYLWGDEFNESTLDTLKWNYNYPWGTTHNHDAVMSPSHVILGDGTVTLQAQRTFQGFTSRAINAGYTKFTFNGKYFKAENPAVR